LREISRGNFDVELDLSRGELAKRCGHCRELKSEFIGLSAFARIFGLSFGMTNRGMSCSARM
jgi:hypothetical protein